MLTPLEFIKKFETEKRTRESKNLEFLFHYTDAFATWIIGFCIAGLTLIVSNYDNIHKNLHATPKPLVVFLMISILSCLLYRVFSYYMIVFDKNLDNYLSGAFGEYELSTTSMDEDVLNGDSKYIIKRLKDDFNIDVIAASTDDELQRQRPSLLNHYQEWCDYNQKQWQIALNHLAEVYETIYKIPKERTSKMFERERLKPSMGYNLKLWRGLTSWTYTIGILSFTLAIGMVCTFLLRHS